MHTNVLLKSLPRYPQVAQPQSLPSPIYTPSMDTEIANLYHELSSQARTLLIELDAFKQHIQLQTQAQTQAQDQPAVPPQAPLPDAGLNLKKFRADVARETKQLEQNGDSLGLQVATATHHNDCEPNSAPAPKLNANTNTAHSIRSSNITHLAAIWDEVKRNQGVTGIRKQVRYTLNPSVPPTSGAASACASTPTPASKWTSSTSKQSSNARQRSKIYHDREAKAQRDGTDEFRIPRSDREVVTIDICAAHGAKWIKVFTKNQRWLAMDLAKEGLVDVGEESGSDGDENDTAAPDAVEALEELKLVKMAREFLTAARTTRVRPLHRHPEVYFVLPKIERGVSADVDAVLEYVENLGITVTTADRLEPRTHHLETFTHHAQPTASAAAAAASDLQSTFSKILTARVPSPLSQTLNIDTTILIALISDISHLKSSTITIPTHYNGRASKTDILAQMASEELDPLLPGHIYPVLKGRKLVCTRAAESHLKGIVRIMGSKREAARSGVLFSAASGNGDGKGGRDAAGVMREFGRNSVHGVPEDLMLPIEVVEDGSEDGGSDPTPSPLDVEVMRRMADQPRLSALNRSVFFHGWKEGMTTVSLNRVVSEWLERAVDGVLDEVEVESDCTGDIAVPGGFVGPRVLVCGRERSLLGNEKRGNHSRADDAD